MPGGTPSAPAAVSWGVNRIDVVVKAADDTIRQLVWDGANGWANWVNIMTAVNKDTAPAIASWGQGRLDMFIRSSSKQLYQATCATSPCKAPAQWSAWIPLGGYLSSAPAAASPRLNNHKIRGRQPQR